MRLTAIRWIALALAGLVVAAGVSLAASQLVSERIGLAAEPVSAGKELAPAEQGQGRDTHGGGDGENTGGSTSTTQTTTAPTVPTTTSPSATPPPATTSPPPANGSSGEHEPADD